MRMQDVSFFPLQYTHSIHAQFLLPLRSHGISSFLKKNMVSSLLQGAVTLYRKIFSTPSHTWDASWGGNIWVGHLSCCLELSRQSCIGTVEGTVLQLTVLVWMGLWSQGSLCIGAWNPVWAFLFFAVGVCWPIKVSHTCPVWFEAMHVLLMLNCFYMLITVWRQKPFANRDCHFLFWGFLAIDPRIQTGIKRGPHMQIFTYGNLVTISPYADKDHL